SASCVWPRCSPHGEPREPTRSLHCGTAERDVWGSPSGGPTETGRHHMAGLRSRHSMTTSVVDPPAHCAKCGASLLGRFCSQCGQKVAPLNPTFGEFLHDLFHEIAHVDGKIVTTLRLLLTRPGFLSLEYFEGRRARYVTPIRLYLLLSVVCF